MLTALTFWVLVAMDVRDNTMLSQQFVSKGACLEAKAFLEDKRGTYIWAKCIKDETPGRDSR